MVVPLAAAPQQPVFRTTTNVVAVDVAVTEGRNPVTGLTAADFEVRDNGVVQTVSLVSDAEQEIDVTLLLGGGLLSQQEDVGQSLLNMNAFRSIVRAGDRLRIVQCNDDVREVMSMQAPSGAPPLASHVSSVRSRGTYDWLALPFNDALFFALAWPADPGRRHLIVVFSSGISSWHVTLAEDLPALARRSNAVVHAVVVDTPPAARSDETRTWVSSDGSTRLSSAAVQAWRENFAVLDQIVRDSGGRLHRLAQGVEAFGNVLAAFRTSYLLQYVPTGVARDGWHDLQVRVVKPGSFTVRARRGYQGR
jgi:hypothetical protein